MRHFNEQLSGAPAGEAADMGEVQRPLRDFLRAGREADLTPDGPISAAAPGLYNKANIVQVHAHPMLMKGRAPVPWLSRISPSGVGVGPDGVRPASIPQIVEEVGGG